jgi:hypothetical protein
MSNSSPLDFIYEMIKFAEAASVAQMGVVSISNLFELFKLVNQSIRTCLHEYSSQYGKEESDNQSVGTFNTFVYMRDPNFEPSRAVMDHILDACIESSDIKYFHADEKTPWCEMFSVVLSVSLGKMVKQVSP